MLTQEQLTNITVSELESLFEQSGAGLSAKELARKKLRLRDIYTAEGVFQPRGMKESWKKEDHVRELAKAARYQSEDGLDPLVVFAIAGKRIVIDGHCRLEAYRQNDPSGLQQIPVRHLTGPFSEALCESASSNSKDKLPLSQNEKSEVGWKLMLFYENRPDKKSLRELSRITGCSKSLLGKMSKILELHPRSAGSERSDPRTLSWAGVLSMGKGQGEYTQDWEDAAAQKLAKRLRKAVGSLPDKQPDLARMAIEIAFPRAYAAIREWELMPELADEEEEEF
jgi:hypothetical protein